MNIPREDLALRPEVPPRAIAVALRSEQRLRSPAGSMGGSGSFPHRPCRQIPWLFAQLGLDASAVVFLDEVCPAKLKGSGRLEGVVLVGEAPHLPSAAPVRARCWLTRTDGLATHVPAMRALYSGRRSQQGDRSAEASRRSRGALPAAREHTSPSFTHLAALSSPARQVEIIDHHDDEGKHESAVRRVAPVGSCASLVVRLPPSRKHPANALLPRKRAEHISLLAPFLPGVTSRPPSVSLASCSLESARSRCAPGGAL